MGPAKDRADAHPLAIQDDCRHLTSRPRKRYAAMSIYACKAAPESTGWLAAGSSCWGCRASWGETFQRFLPHTSSSNAPSFATIPATPDCRGELR
jgi:hypothetical protein